MLGEMGNPEVAALLLRIADLLEIQGDNPFKIRAYREAARQVADLTTPIDVLWREQKLRAVPGVGAAIAAKVGEYLDTGRLAFLERLEEAVPPALLTLREIPGVGPRTAKEIYDGLGITTVDALEAAARAEQLRTLPGIKAKTEENIRKGIEVWRRRHGRLLLAQAQPLATALLARLCALPEVHQAEAAGSVRRQVETVGDLDLLVATNRPAAVVETFVRGPEVAQVLAAGATKASIRTTAGLQADLRVVDAEAFGAALQYFTGSQAHNIELRGYAERRGLKINEYGVFTSGGERVGGTTEGEVYAAVGLPWIPPELREGHGEIEAAERGALPDLVTAHDLRGDLRVRLEGTRPSEAILEAARAARSLGRQYLILTVDPATTDPAELVVLRHHAAALVPEVSLLIGAEMELLSDGTPAVAHERLAAYDWVVGCCAETATPGEATRAFLGALALGAVDVLADPLGRRLPAPAGPAPDMTAIIAAAARAHVALEIDGRPDRLDLNDAWARRAHETGVPLALASVAADARGLGALESALAVARRAWCARHDILNTRPLGALQEWRSGRRAGIGPAAPLY